MSGAAVPGHLLRGAGKEPKPRDVVRAGKMRAEVMLAVIMIQEIMAVALVRVADREDWVDWAGF